MKERIKGKNERRDLLRDEREAVAGAVGGRNAVRELLAGGRDIEKIFISKGEREGSISKLIFEARERKIPIVEVERKRLDAMVASANHQGIVAIASEKNYCTLDDIIDRAHSLGESPLIVLLDGVEDPHNLGAIIRNAECAGAHGIVIPKRRASGLTATVAKSSAGAIEHMLISKVSNLTSAINELKDRGVWIYGADMDGTPYFETDLTGGVGIVLGNEGEGISRLVEENCDFKISIPMYGNVNSMNVSAAGAVLLCEAARQRHK